ncbi:MAG: hypothetical protein U0929_01805 [Planctomycetaceae bacterium]
MRLSIRLLVLGCITSLSLYSVVPAAEGHKLAVVVGVITFHETSDGNRNCFPGV